jgi:hypothetical protein
VIEGAQAVIVANKTIHCDEETDNSAKIGLQVKDSIKSSIQNFDYTNCIYCLKDIELNLLNSLYSKFNESQGLWMVEVNVYDDRDKTKIVDIFQRIPRKINDYLAICRINNLFFTLTNFKN